MKRKIITLLLAMSLTSMLSVSVVAAEDTKISGFYDIGTEQNVEINAFSGNTAVSATEKNLDSDDALEKVYENSVRLEVTYQAATKDAHYGVILIEGSGLPTKDTEIYYINQEKAGSSIVDFNVYPKLPETTTDMSLYISSSEEDVTLVKIPLNYAVNAAIVAPAPEYTPGDVDDDTFIDVKDVILTRQHIAGGYGIVINEAAANVNGDTLIDVKDVITLRKYITGGYDVELK